MRYLKPLFWVCFAPAMIIYAIMLIWSLPTISAAANGFAPFDMRPAGYSYAEAKAFLAALSPDATQFYRDVQIGLLDLFYPGLITLSFFLAIGLLARIWIGNWGWALALISLPIALFDYMENANIRLMLFLGPDNITEQIVETASSRTFAKAIFTTGTMSVLLLLCLLWIWRWFQSRSATD